GIADIAVERLDVVSVGVEQVRGVIAGRVVAKAGLAVGTESRLRARAVKGVDVRAGPGVEAEVEIRRRRRLRDDVHVREARRVFVLVQLRDAERREDGLVEPHACRKVAGANVEVVDNTPCPIPFLRAYNPG